MVESGMVALLVRTMVSLGIVLAVIGVAYIVMRRRAGLADHATPRRSRARTAPAPLNVLGRAGLSRTSSVVAVRFGERVLLVGATEGGAPTTLAEMTSEQWDELTVVRDRVAIGDQTGSPVVTRPSFLDALRDATSRRG